MVDYLLFQKFWWKGEVASPPPTKMNSRVKLSLVVVTFVWAGCMQNFRPLGYSPGWGGSYCDYITNLSPKLGLNWDWLGLSLAIFKTHLLYQPDLDNLISIPNNQNIISMATSTQAWELKFGRNSRHQPDEDNLICLT